MKQDQLIIRIPQPCSEPWFDMEATKNGRTCGKCHKELIDFTTYSNAQLANFMAEESGEICGRFSPRQLNKNLLPATASYSGLSLPALALLAATLTVNPAQAQTESIPSNVELVAKQDSLKNGKSLPITISGVAKEEGMDEVFPGAVIELRYNGATVQRTATDMDGRFKFNLPPDTQFDSIKARFPEVKDTVIAYSPEMAGNDLTIYLQAESVEELPWIGIVKVSKKQMRKNHCRHQREQRRQNR